MAGMLTLTPERARIFRITHIDNVPWILENGLHCGSSNVRDPGFIQIGTPDAHLRNMVQNAGVQLSVACRPTWFF